MKVRVEELRSGCIVTKDVMGKSRNPIIPKNTVVKDEHIEVLKAFLIDTIEIENFFADGKSLKGKEKQQPESDMKDEAISIVPFIKLYKTAVERYKKEFEGWQTGLPVNISSIRSFLIPLFEKAYEEKEWIKQIHTYSNKSNYHYHHPIAVSLISSFIAKQMGFSKGESLQIALAGCLADCGMARVNSSFITMERKLNEQEWIEVNKHPVHSFQMVKDIALLKSEAKLAIFQHHERLDGSGYPLGEKGKKISTASQIIAISDIYHAMTAERVYKQVQSPFKTLQVMEEDLFGKLDISILKVLINSIATMPVGSHVLLSNQQIGEVLFNKPDAPTRPLLKDISNNSVIDMEKNRHLHIESIVKF